MRLDAPFLSFLAFQFLSTPMKSQASNDQRRNRNRAYVTVPAICLGRARFAATATDWPSVIQDLATRIQDTTEGGVDRRGDVVPAIVNIAAFGRVTKRQRNRVLAGLPPSFKVTSPDVDPTYEPGQRVTHWADWDQPCRS